jgi:O-antigen/teichoic acid export membrane protein
MVISIAWKFSGIRPERPPLSRSTLHDFGEFIHGGLGFLGWQIAQMAYSQIDRLLLGALVATTEVGWYSAAARIIAIPIFIPTLVITPLFPALSRSAHQPDVLRKSLRQALKVILLLTVPLSAGTIVVAPRIPSLFGWPADFEHAIPLMRIMALQLPIVSVGMVLGAVVMAIGREKRFVLIAVIATVFNVAANLAAIQLLEHMLGNGAIGAAIVMVSSEMVMLAGALVLIPKNLLDWRMGSDALRICAAGAATVVVGVLLEPIALALCIVGGAIACAAVAVVVRALTLDEVAYLRRVVLSRGK